MQYLIKMTGYFLIFFGMLSGLSIGGRIPDTGQDKCYSDLAEVITCPDEGEDFYGQDAQYVINPQSYTKLDNQGKELPDSAAQWAMVRDNVTGLIWENKTDDGSISDKGNKYTWDDAQKVFIPGLNQKKLGGYSDWRLPTVKELASLSNKGDIYYPTLNTKYFPNTKDDDYWSSDKDVSNENSVWLMPFWYSCVNSTDTSDSYYVRGVRGGDSSKKRSASDRFIIKNGTVTDTSTGLIWQQSGGGDMNWKEALAYCENLSFAGYSDWRLPDINELQSLLDYEKAEPATDTNAFSDTASCPFPCFYWSSTTRAIRSKLSNSAWVAGFYDGYVSTLAKSNILAVRAVRGGISQGGNYLETAIVCLKIISGHTVQSAIQTDDISGDKKIGLEEAVHYVRKAAGF